MASGLMGSYLEGYVVGEATNTKGVSSVSIIKESKERGINIVTLSEENKAMLEQITKCNAVCVHIRRGDYISNSKNAALVVCDEIYYKNAMKYIGQNVESPVFYVFSDNNEEIAWIKENYHLPYDVRYVMLNNPDYEELRLMYHCKHFIIANSTFSWWGAYLADYQDKIIVAPNTWSKTYNNCVDTYLPEMIRLQ